MYISIYLHLTKMFLKAIVSIYTLFMALIYLIQLPSNLKYNKGAEPIITVLFNTLLQLPEFATEVSSFIILFASFYCFKTLNTSKELVIFKSVGLSIWKILLPFIVTTLLFAVFVLFGLTFLNIKSSNYLLSNKNSTNEAELVSVYNKDIWIVDKPSNNNQTIILTNNLAKQNNNLLIGKAIVFQIKNSQLVNLINAQSGIIQNNTLVLSNLTIKDNTSNKAPENLDSLVIAFSVKLNKFNNFNLSPKQTYLWNMPNTIKYLKQTSLNALEFEVAYFKQLGLPILMLTLLLLGVYFAISNQRVQNAIIQTMAIVLIGFLLFFVNNFLSSLAYSGTINIAIATIVFYASIFFILVSLIIKKEGI